ncbi:MAG TPA: sugar transferase [Acidimicrobiales bacterium]|nr:sugar transferase [Acidimicrobiales bacterium]
MDIVGGALLSLAAVPLIAVGTVVVMVTLRTTSPFFTQTRIGRNGRELRFPKLRTMPRSMPAYALKTEVSFDHLPRPMKFLRRMHIDELPQLFLVVTGALSLVGPRPKMPDAVEPVDAAYGAARVRVRQGCTGLWQISTAKSLLPKDHPEYDLFYVEHQSLRLDLWILWRTLMHGLRLTNLITLDDVPAWTLRQGATRRNAPVLDLTPGKESHQRANA